MPSPRKIIPFVTAALVFLLSFTTVAHAAGAVEPADGSLLDLLQPVLKAFQSGQYLLAGAASLVVAVALARRYLTPRVPFLSTDAGGALLVLLGSFGGTLTAAWATATPTWGSVDLALKLAFSAAGGYTAVKKLVVEPYGTYLADKGPKWLHAPLRLVLWIFESIPAPAAPSIAPSTAPAAPPAAPPAA